MGFTDFFSDVISSFGLPEAQAEAPPADTVQETPQAEDPKAEHAESEEAAQEEPEEEAPAEEAEKEAEEEEEEEPEDIKPQLEEGEFPFFFHTIAVMSGVWRRQLVSFFRPDWGVWTIQLLT